MTAATVTTLNSAPLTMGRAECDASPLAYRLAGLAFATVLPAVFWVAVAAGIGRVAGVEFTPTTLIASGTAIAAFLGSVCAPIVLKSQS